MKAIGRIVRFIPGFRQMSSSSMIIAVTYYGAAILISFRYWYWGLALLALPFLVFHLLDLNAMKGRRLPLAISVAAGLCVLLGTAVGLSTGGLPGNGGGEAGVYGATPARTYGAATSRATAAPTVSPSPEAGPAAPAESRSPALSPDPAKTAPQAPAAPEASSPSPAPQTAAPGPDEAQYAFVASKTSEVFHLPGCSSAKRILPENLIGFQTREEALAAGLRPCQRCKP